MSRDTNFCAHGPTDTNSAKMCATGQVMRQKQNHTPFRRVTQLACRANCWTGYGSPARTFRLSNHNLLEKVLAVPDNEGVLVSIDTQIDMLPNPLQVHVVASFDNSHGPILTSFADEMLPMDRCQPGVWINRRRERRQSWQVRKSHARRLIATGKPLMRTLSVVMNQEGVSHLTNLLKRLGMKDLETFLVRCSIESFSKRIFVWSMGWTHIGLNPHTKEKTDQRRGKVASCGSPTKRGSRSKVI